MKTKRPGLIGALLSLDVLGVLVLGDITPAQFHSTLKRQRARFGNRRFRTFIDRFEGKVKLFVVRVH